ncbi:MAG: amidohydrolase family protein [Proteobacteria bacterium]|nr:amidohydrolase family protein [Pseudomonadota bacterium]NIS68789.1 amidohydrolase family protein [Pseudomonadota bacterium]
MSMTVIRNIRTLVSGDIDKPLLDADTLVVRNGKFSQIGKEDTLDTSGADRVIDAQGTTVTPGLIDSHCHVVLGDYTPRQKMLDFIESSLHGGVTTAISAGEVHLPGRPKDVAGTKALAILAAKSFSNARPGGVKVHGGALILEPGLQEKDFQELAGEGVRIVGEIGLGAVKRPEDAVPMVKWAKKYGMVVMMHSGGTSIPGSSVVTADQIMATDPHIVTHINGGPTALSLDEARKLVEKTSYIIEIAHCGNMKRAAEVMEVVKKANALDRVIIGNDAPSGTGVVPLGILRVVSLISSFSDIPAERALAMATGNTAKVHKLNTGMIKEGMEADLVIMDGAMGSVGKDALSCLMTGDIPGVGLVMVDGAILVKKSRNTPPPARMWKEV